MSASNEALAKIHALRIAMNKRDARALGNDQIIFEHFKPIDINNEANKCVIAGDNSFNYWEQHKGAQQCVNSIHSSTVGMYGEAVAEKYFAQLGYTVEANWREWIRGVADDTKPDLIIRDSVGDELAVEVKTITRATDPKGQVTVKHLEKYAQENKIVVCVRYDEGSGVGYVYAVELATNIKAYNNKELNLYNQECYRAISTSHQVSETILNKNFMWL